MPSGAFPTLRSPARSAPAAHALPPTCPVKPWSPSSRPGLLPATQLNFSGAPNVISSIARFRPAKKSELQGDQSPDLGTAKSTFQSSNAEIETTNSRIPANGAICIHPPSHLSSRSRPWQPHQQNTIKPPPVIDDQLCCNPATHVQKTT
jgi:hypothetical protein